MIPLKRYCFKCTRQLLTSVQRSFDNKLSYQSLLRLMSINLFFLSDGKKLLCFTIALYSGVLWPLQLFKGSMSGLGMLLEFVTGC